MKLDQEELKRLLNYNYKTGIFKWKISTNGRIKIDSIAGSVGSTTYVQIKVHSKQYLAHRLAWLYMYGEFPNGNIDHINRDRLDNRIENLRIAKPSENTINSKDRNDNSTGIRGVYSSKKNKYSVYINVNGKRIYSKELYDLDEAACWRLAFEQCFGFDKLDGESSAYLHVKNYLISRNKDESKNKDDFLDTDWKISEEQKVNLSKNSKARKLTNEQILEIKKSNISPKILAKKYNVAVSTIGYARRKDKWIWLIKEFEYS